MNNASEEMKHLHTLAKRDPGKRFDHLWERVCDPRWLSQAWEEIRSNKGSMTPGVDHLTAVDVDVERIRKLAKRIRTHRYRPRPVRRVLIPKANGKQRPLGIPTIEDRIVQQAITMLLEPIFEADFLPCSHGFRRARSPHTALRDVARRYGSVSWTIEGDIQGCFDNIPHRRLLQAVARRIADRKLLCLIRSFLTAGYVDQWQYHHTYSGTPQGGILSPLLANIFLHQLDEFMVKRLGANRTQSKRESAARRNPAYRQLEHRLARLRRQLRQAHGADRKALLTGLKALERQQRRMPYYAKAKRHPSTVGYIRYADDFVVLVQGSKQVAEDLKRQVGETLQHLGLTLSEEKTRITHWSHAVSFLGYRIWGRRRQKGVGIRAKLGIPREKLRRIQEELQQVTGYHHIPEADVIIRMRLQYRGWCNYYRFANAPQRVFGQLAQFVWWRYAHYLAGRQRSSIAAMLRREHRAGRLKAITKGHRTRTMFLTYVGEKTFMLDTFPPPTGQIKALPNTGDWTVDLKPVLPAGWQSGRSLATRLAAWERAKGICERCGEKPATQIHHTVPLRGKSFLARIASDHAQRYTAVAVCKECHLAAHGGSLKSLKQRSNRNAGYAERCSSGVGSAA